MANVLENVSRTFNEYLLIPRLTDRDCVYGNISLKTTITKYKNGNDNSAFNLNIPLVSAAMQSVSDSTMAIELAKHGGLSFIYCSQSIQNQCEMIHQVKSHKAGFVVSDSNLRPTQTISDLLEAKKQTGHATFMVTIDGSSNGLLLGMVTSRDLRLSRLNGDEKIETFMTPFNKLKTATLGISLNEANDLIWNEKLNCLPIIDESQHLCYLVFRKDYDNSKSYPLQLVDMNKRYMVGAAINTWDYKERVPALIDAGVDIIFVDSSDGYSEFQADTIKWVKKNAGKEIKIGGGNVVYPDAFHYLVQAGADFIKIGVGGGSICTTREQKGIGRGQASAIIDIAEARDKYCEDRGVYIPLCADGGIVHDYHIALSLAMGADFVMLGRYFARFDESPGKKTQINNQIVKEHWGEGTVRSANWQRYSDNGKPTIVFEEGVDSFVPYVGSMENNLNKTLTKLKSTMINCGSKNIPEFHNKALLTVVSASSIVEGGAHDLIARPLVE